MNLFLTQIIFHSIANLQTSKFKDTGDVDSDSDSEIEEVNGNVEEEST